MKKINLISDLHLESSNCSINISNTDYLVIAGDLSADHDLIWDFFEYKAPKDIPIIYVLGNHEFEGRDIDTNVNEIKVMLSEFKNVHILDNESIVLDGIKFIGSTLWSNFELDGIAEQEKNMNWAGINIVDFHKIYKKIDLYTPERYRKLTPKDMVELNKKAYYYLEFELKKNPFEGSKVVVTHFAPHKNSIHPKYKKSFNSYWVNSFEELLGFSDFWFHGHTHNSFEYSVEGTVVACNPRGYSRMFDMSENQNYNKEKRFEVKAYIEPEIKHSELKRKF